ncbi:MAG: phosphoribosyltransferase [Propionibacteriales bacterium]|nr:phosphoribosyltransferase [Propionibacteriales bacterium]
MLYRDRTDAGRQLAQRLMDLKGEPAVVLGLPRGGVPVGFEIAQALDVPLDVLVVRKLGVPFHSELGMGAIGEDGVRLINEEVVREAAVGDEDLVRVEERERAELARRTTRFRADRSRVDLGGRTAIIVDDGIATGFTARAACRIARAQGAARVVLAVPVAPSAEVGGLGEVADEVICPETPEMFMSIGQFYDDFTQTTDDEVVDLLRRSTPDRAADPPAEPVLRDEEVRVGTGRTRLAGHLTVPSGSTGVVVFVHGSGSGRHSPRNRFVAEVLNDAGMGTLLFDLLTPEEEGDRANVFDIPLLAGRLAEVTRWMRAQPEARDARVGYFGASTGAAAALWAAADPDSDVAAVVSRGGRPDLAADLLGSVRAPTLLIVGGRDELVLDLNRQAQAAMRCATDLRVVPDATHLFEEPGMLEAVAEMASGWFSAWLATGDRYGRGLGDTP